MKIFVYLNNPKIVFGSLILVGVVFKQDPPTIFSDITEINSANHSTFRSLLQNYSSIISYSYVEITPRMLAENKTLSYYDSIQSIVGFFIVTTSSFHSTPEVLLHRFVPFTDLSFSYSLGEYPSHFHIAKLISQYFRLPLLKAQDAYLPIYSVFNHRGYMSNEHLSLLKKHGATPLHHHDLVPRCLSYLYNKIKAGKDADLIKEYVTLLPDWWINFEKNQGNNIDSLLDYFSSNEKQLDYVCNKIHNLSRRKDLISLHNIFTKDTNCKVSKRYNTKFKQWLRNLPDLPVDINLDKISDLYDK